MHRRKDGAIATVFYLFFSCTHDSRKCIWIAQCSIGQLVIALVRHEFSINGKASRAPTTIIKVLMQKHEWVQCKINLYSIILIL